MPEVGVPVSEQTGDALAGGIVFVPPWVNPVRAPAGYYFDGYLGERRGVVLTPDGAIGEDLFDPRGPGIYLGDLISVRRKPRVAPIPAVVACWQSSEDAPPS